MLELIDIKKDYAVAGEAVHALKGVSVKFRNSEFVSILGASGCGKTTLLNIIGGLDHYTSGDLIIEGRSTKQYKDGDWDTYRNHSIGFIFQSYHLIPHQTILQNVELALMISGVSKKERRQRAIEALEKVGLSDKIHNRPNQLSGGQAQRVAIARALINDPEIVLADEPTGALDSVTSVQIMELLKEISKDRLVIMVTHNPELAEKYSTRIIRLLDGLVTDDSMPFNGESEPVKEQAAQEETERESAAAESGAGNGGKKNKGKKASMSVGMAMGLSLKNLLSKRKRTAMVSVAGSIGIIGVSMVLAISAGVQGYIHTMENDMLSGYPISVTQSTYDFTSLMQLSHTDATDLNYEELIKGNKVYVNSLLDTLGTFSKGFEKTNNITPAYVSYVQKMPEEYVNLVQYGYDFKLGNNLYTNFKVSENLSEHLKEGDTSTYEGGVMSVSAIRAMYGAVLSHVKEYEQWGSMISTVRTFAEVPDNFEYIMSQYDVLAFDKDGQAVTEGYTQEELEEAFNAKETLVMVLEDFKIADLTLAQYGYFTEDEFLDYAYKGVGNEDVTLVGEDGFPYSTFVGDEAKKFTYYPNDCIYTKAQYKAKPQYDDNQIRAMMKLMGASNTELGEQIINVRKQGDEALKTFLTGMIMAMNPNEPVDENQVEEYFQMFRLPSEDEFTEGYVANAYTNAYTMEEDDITLEAFSDKAAYSKRVEMGVKIILQKKQDISYGCLDHGFYYTHALTEYILGLEKESEIVKDIKTNGELPSIPLNLKYYYVCEEDGQEYYVLEEEKASIEAGNTNFMGSLVGNLSGMTSKQVTAAMLGGDDTPTSVYFYPIDFNYKNKITAYLDEWNNLCKDDGGTQYTYCDASGTQHTVTLEEKDKITYTDTVGMIINMINTMIEMITIALVAFTALSLVVSTVMIGIITYVSVVERVKEIGILRAVGARKKDIKRLFNAETFIIGLAAGLFGIIVTYLLSLIINVIVLGLAGIWGIAALPWWQALIMIILSVMLTLISGLIPASAAAKKDPVVALRTE